MALVFLLILCCSIFYYECVLLCVCFRFSVLIQEIGWEERLQTDIFCVDRVGRKTVKPQLSQSSR